MARFSALPCEQYALKVTQRENQTLASMLHDLIMQLPIFLSRRFHRRIFFLAKSDPHRNLRDQSQARTLLFWRHHFTGSLSQHVKMIMRYD